MDSSSYSSFRCDWAFPQCFTERLGQWMVWLRHCEPLQRRRRIASSSFKSKPRVPNAVITSASRGSKDAASFRYSTALCIAALLATDIRQAHPGVHVVGRFAESGPETLLGIGMIPELVKGNAQVIPDSRIMGVYFDSAHKSRNSLSEPALAHQG